MPEPKIKLPTDRIKEFCQKWNVQEFSLFGSVVSEDFHPDSDIDVIVAFNSRAQHSLFDMVSMRQELEDLFGRDVDLMTKDAVEQSRNYIRRKAIMSSREVVYVS